MWDLGSARIRRDDDEAGGDPWNSRGERETKEDRRGREHRERGVARYRGREIKRVRPETEGSDEDERPIKELTEYERLSMFLSFIVFLKK